MKTSLPGFARDRRGAVAMMAGLALVPMVLLVGLAIDYSFFAEARSQVQLAADAAAAHAVRAAAETFSMDTAEGDSQSAAESDAITAGNLAGANWFPAQLGQLPTASVPLTAQVCNTPTANTLCVETTATASPVGFNAAVAYQGSYPPFFDGLFHTTSTWGINGTSGASANYGYAEVVLMLDTSPNMEFGADQSDIVAMEDLSACINPSAVSGYDGAGNQNLNSIGVNRWYNYGTNGNSYAYGSVGYTSDNPPPKTGGPGTTVSLNVDQSGIGPGYTPNTNNPANPGTCSAPYNASYNGHNDPFEPCALACHTDPNNTGPASQDLYGIIRASTNPKITLRLDVVLAATEQVIQTMIQNEQTPGQFSVGVFQFNVNVSPIVQGTVGTDPLPYEATTQLNTALTDVYNIDYNHNPSETSIPIAVTQAQDYTDFQTSMKDLINGTHYTSLVSGSLTQDAATSRSATATPAQNPAKNIFIVTDGYDDYNIGARGRGQGPFTGVNAETNSSDKLYPGICKQLKNLGYTVYVLYVPYWSLSNAYYQTGSSNINPTSFYTDDGGTVPSGNYTPKQFAEPPPSGTTGPAAYGGFAPDVAALRACASNTITDYAEADDSADIAVDMQLLLKQALQSSIRVTQ